MWGNLADKISDGIRFENVGFRYAGTDVWAVRNVSFHLRAGEKLALVGENGAGKTTLVKLLARMYDPSEGAILLVGSARPKPVVIDNEITVRDIGWFSLSFDHRFIDGAAAAAFLQDLNTFIANPVALVDEPDQAIG